MSIKVDMTSTDVDRQIELLRYYPEVVEKHYRNLLIADSGLLRDEIRPNIPRKTGKAEKTFRSRVTGKGIDMQAQVGWWGKGSAWYINVVEYGAGAHEMNTFVSSLGKYIKTHPGFSARGFMAAGYSAIQPIITADMAVAGENVVNEMAVK